MFRRRSSKQGCVPSCSELSSARKSSARRLPSICSGGRRVSAPDHGRRYVYTVIKQEVAKLEQVNVSEEASGQRGIALVACTPLSCAAFRLGLTGRLLDGIPVEVQQ